MRALWYRFKYTVQEELDNLFNEKEKGEVESEKMLSIYVKEAEKQTEEVRHVIGKQRKVIQDLEKELEEASQLASKRKNQLQRAINLEEADLIAFAEMEVERYEQREKFILTSLKDRIDELRALETKYETMKHQVKDMKIRQLTYVGKENVKRAHEAIDQAFSSKSNQFTLPTIQEVEQYFQTLGRKMNVIEEPSSIEKRLDALENKRIADGQ